MREWKRQFIVIKQFWTHKQMEKEEERATHKKICTQIYRQSIRHTNTDSHRHTPKLHPKNPNGAAVAACVNNNKTIINQNDTQNKNPMGVNSISLYLEFFLFYFILIHCYCCCCWMTIEYSSLCFTSLHFVFYYYSLVAFCARNFILLVIIINIESIERRKMCVWAGEEREKISWIKRTFF